MQYLANNIYTLLALAFIGGAIIAFTRYPGIKIWLREYVARRKKTTATQRAVNACRRDCNRLSFAILTCAETYEQLIREYKRIGDFKRTYEGKVPVDVFNGCMTQLTDLYDAVLENFFPDMASAG